MTSKKLSYNFAKDNLKHKLGIMILSVIFSVVFAFGFLIVIHNAYLNPEGLLTASMSAQQVIMGVATPNTFLVILMLGMGTVFAFSSFSYLHTKSKVDLYHSLPIKRESIFLVNIINDVIIFVVPFLVAWVVVSIAAATASALTGSFILAVVNSVICYLLAFMAAYLTMALAMIMTGNHLTGILGFAVFMAYFPLILRGVVPSYCSMFFDSYVEGNIGSSFLKYYSPATLSALMATSYGSWSWATKGKYVAYTVVLIILLFCLCIILHKKRESEMAGKSMAFARTKDVIRILLVIPFALYTGCLFYAVLMESSKIWVVLGTVIGTVFFHAFIEVIYQCDFRAIRSHKKQMAATGIVVLAIVAIFWFDPLRYNTYVPTAQKVESIAVRLDHYPGYDSYWSEEFMEIKGEGLSDLLTDIQDVANCSSEENSRNVKVIYRMKNGKTMERSYYVEEKVQEAVAKKIFDTPEYKKEVYYLYKNKWDTISDIHSDTPESSTAAADLSKSEQKEFLKIYQKDLDTLTFKEMRNVEPIGAFWVDYMINKTDTISEHYYIYPSFKNTLAYCEKKNILQAPSLTDYNIKKLTVNIYDEDYNLKNSYTVTDSQEIKKIAPKLKYTGDIYASGYKGAEEYEYVEIGAEASIGGDIYNLSLNADEEVLQELINKGEETD